MLVLAPTRELANQVSKVAEQLSQPQGLGAISIYGGVPYDRQEYALTKGVDIVVGTPGRVIDLLDRVRILLSSSPPLPSSRDDIQFCYCLQLKTLIP